MTKPLVISVENVDKWFGKFHVLQSIDLKVSQGEKIVICGPSGSGKSTTARNVAQKLGFVHINTGAMYRGIALKCIEKNVEPKDHVLIQEILNETLFEFGGDHYSELYMDGRNISSDIKSSKITESVSQISAVDIVREKLVKYQQEMAKISERLSNKGFTDRAPKNIVEQEKTNYSNLKDDIKKISLTIKSL